MEVKMVEWCNLLTGRGNLGKGPPIQAQELNNSIQLSIIL